MPVDMTEVAREEMQAVLETENEEIASLKNELAILKQLHGEACQGWSKWQQQAERYLAALRFNYGLADGARSLVLSRNQLLGILRLIERSARNELPEFDELPY